MLEPCKQAVNDWLILKPEADLCVIDPKHEVDLCVTADLRPLTPAWMGHSTLAHELVADPQPMLRRSA